LTQIGLVATQFLQCLDKEYNDAGSIFDLIPAYFEYQINTHPDYNEATLNLTSDCAMFINQQAKKDENDDKQDAVYYALQYCQHRFYVIHEIPVDPPITSTP
jgi:hypothetical protein